MDLIVMNKNEFKVIIVEMEKIAQSGEEDALFTRAILELTFNHKSQTFNR